MRGRPAASMPNVKPVVIGLIADTHGLVRPGVHTALAGVSLILHAGDVGGDDVLDELALIAPVEAVFGNMDSDDDPRLAREVIRDVNGVRIHVSHGHELGQPRPDALAARYEGRVLVYGHTHRALITRLDARLVVNPGAAGPRRFNLEPSVARLTIDQRGVHVAIVPLDA
ncbi:MAG TPA: YfcE family phosphodiesterase [Gemmatimonadaceae bacterium]|nr:YfcE family phosphodiesterase [Gemmatimonadaceae bacterium]